MHLLHRHRFAHWLLAAALLALLAGCGGGSPDGLAAPAAETSAATVDGTGMRQSIDAPTGLPPQPSSASGQTGNGQVLVIHGSRFNQKANARPLLYWSADTGKQPSALGRKTAWDGSFSGELVERGATGAVVATGSTFALRQDYNTTSAAILARVSFESDRLYVWRKRYDDFDRAVDFGIRTRYTDLFALKGGLGLQPGMLMSTLDKRVWGKIIQHTRDATIGTGTAYYSNAVGNVADKALAASVAAGELLNFYDGADVGMTRPLYQARLKEGQGIYHTFNHKVFRLWAEIGVEDNDTYFSLDADGSLVSENTQVKTLWMGDWNHPIDSAKRRWVNEEVQYQASTIDQADGILAFWQDRVQGVSAEPRLRFRTSAHPKRYADLYQTQVSNGVQPRSYEYVDSLYVDDSWHRVLLCAQATWSACTKPEVQIPTAWTDTQVSVVVRRAGLQGTSPLYVYVVNGQGEVNAQGLRID